MVNITFLYKYNRDVLPTRSSNYFKYIGMHNNRSLGRYNFTITNHIALTNSREVT